MSGNWGEGDMKDLQARLKTQHKGHKSALLQLWLRDYVAVETVERLAQVDIMVRSPTGKHFGIEVKTMRQPNWWQISKRPDGRSSRLWIFITLNQKDTPDASAIKHYLRTTEEVQELWDQEEYNKRENAIRCGIRHRAIKRGLEQWGKLPK